MSAVAHDHLHGHDDHAHDHPHGWRRWLFATNHKDIGTMYLWFSFTMFITGGILALGIRTELFQPGLQVFQPEFFNQLTSMHGLIMVFGAIMPAFVGFANWMIPLQIGAPDMAFARMNNFSFWLLPPAAMLLVASFFVPGGAIAAGWTVYAPLTLQMGMGMDMGIFALHIMGASSIMGSINIVVTVLNLRAPGMTLMKMPLFCWTWLITAYLLIAVMPVLAGAPPGMKNEPTSSSAAGISSQKLRLFMRANAMSDAPICIGISQFAKPTKAGMMAPKTMISPCIVVSWLNSSGLKNCSPGWNSSLRMPSASTPPVISITKLNSRYIVPMSLWFVA
jgi:hypothetical protein